MTTGSQNFPPPSPSHPPLFFHKPRYALPGRDSKVTFRAEEASLVSQVDGGFYRMKAKEGEKEANESVID